jgi:hypothetical protein
MNARAKNLACVLLTAALGCSDRTMEPDGDSPTRDGGVTMDAAAGPPALADAAAPGDAALAGDAATRDAAQPAPDASPAPHDAGEPGRDAAPSGDDTCTPGLCQHGGTCSPGDGGSTCACAPGFEGAACEHDIDECAASPCLHATGCSDAVDDFTCTCEPGWFGKTCDTSCDDGDDGTADTFHATLGCAHRKGDFSTFASGLIGDHVTGLGWAQLPTVLGYDDAKAACASLALSGHDDFRMPSIDDARSLGGGCTATSPGGTCPISDPTCLSEACGYGTASECLSCLGGDASTAQHPTGGYCRPDSPLCDNWWTRSVCSDCAGGDVWFYGVSNGNFYHTEPVYGRPAACVVSLPEL